METNPERPNLKKYMDLFSCTCGCKDILVQNVWALRKAKQNSANHVRDIMWRKARSKNDA